MAVGSNYKGDHGEIEQNSKVTFKYQENMGSYANEMHQVFKHFISKVEKYAGGFKDKVVLEFGAGYQFPPGGINLDYAAKTDRK